MQQYNKNWKEIWQIYLFSYLIFIWIRYKQPSVKIFHCFRAGLIPLPQVIDTVTYDLYESNNPFRQKTDKKFDNKALRYTVNATSAVGAEAFSVFTNPYYLTHKIVNLPVMYKNVANIYKKYSTQDKKINS